ncbi:MAG: hypothetical protein ABSD68_03420 [Candidatus Micrarchaeales archaeon]
MHSGRTQKGEERSQSAIEYLVTYGWAILIVAVVLSILFQLGVFQNPILPFVCLGNPTFLCHSEEMSSSGALTVTLDYSGSTPITITGLGCNVTAPPKGPSIETQSFTLQPQQTVKLVFQCPITNTALGSTSSIYLWFFYNTPTATGLEQQYAKGIVKVNYASLLWNVKQWTPSDSGIQLLPYSSVTANPVLPSGTTITSSGVWSSLIYDQGEGWSYATQYHLGDIYNGIETIGFPSAPLNLDNAPCTGPPYGSHGYTAITNTVMSGTYTFGTWTDDGTEMFYRNLQGGGWTSIFSGSAWSQQAPTFYANKVTFPSGTYQLAVDFIDTCDPAGMSMVLINPPPTPA